MSDLISRADAIEAVGKLLVDGQTARVDGKFVPLHFALMNVLSTLPSASVEAEWIPVSERLPSVYEDVLFCDANQTERGFLTADKGWWQFGRFTFMPKEKVTAWMPVPRPYEGSE